MFAEETRIDDAFGVALGAGEGVVDNGPVGQLGHLQGVAGAGEFAKGETAVQNEIGIGFEGIRIDENRGMGGAVLLGSGKTIVGPVPDGKSVVRAGSVPDASQEAIALRRSQAMR